MVTTIKHEPTHEMYLNNFKAPSPTAFCSHEPTHEMYLNVIFISLLVVFSTRTDT